MVVARVKTGDGDVVDGQAVDFVRANFSHICRETVQGRAELTTVEPGSNSLFRSFVEC